jgi:hypothetical protein
MGKYFNELRKSTSRESLVSEIHDFGPETHKKRHECASVCSFILGKWLKLPCNPLYIKHLPFVPLWHPICSIGSGAVACWGDREGLKPSASGFTDSELTEGCLMKRLLLLAALALALPLSAFAGSVDFANLNGTLVGSAAGLTLTSTLTQVDGFNGGGLISGSNLGSVDFTTGSYIDTVGSGVGSIAYFNGGGSFTITGNGTDGLPSGVIFSGTFSGQVQLTLTNIAANGSKTYTLSGDITGTWYNGKTVSGGTSQIYLFTGKDGWMGTAMSGSGDTLISTVPEPSTLGLLGTGLVGLAGVVRRKLKS